MKRLISAAALALPLLTAGIATAGEPMKLTEGQMDGVTAGGSALALASAAGVGSVVYTGAETLAGVAVLHSISSEATTISLVGSKSFAAAEVSAH